MTLRSARHIALFLNPVVGHAGSIDSVVGEYPMGKFPVPLVEIQKKLRRLSVFNGSCRFTISAEQPRTLETDDLRNGLLI